MYRKPAFAGVGILTIFYKVIAATECAEALVEDSFLKFDAPAEIGYKVCVYARDFID